LYYLPKEPWDTPPFSVACRFPSRNANNPRLSCAVEEKEAGAANLKLTAGR
jgi:hypothetical protein